MSPIDSRMNVPVTYAVSHPLITNQNLVRNYSFPGQTWTKTMSDITR